jgi:hypothetical protein
MQMNEQKIDQLIAAIESLTEEVRMLGHGDATGRRDEPKFGAIELLGMKLLDKIDSTANLAHIQSIKRDEVFAAAALAGLLANYGDGVEPYSDTACIAYKYAECLEEKFYSENAKD